MNFNDAINALIDDDDAIDFATRSLLIADASLDDAIDDAMRYDDRFRSIDRIRTALTLINALIDAADAESLTRMRLDRSICPMHAIDYAICFDDDDDACAAIRAIHPDHDT